MALTSGPGMQALIRKRSTAAWMALISGPDKLLEQIQRRSWLLVQDEGPICGCGDRVHLRDVCDLCIDSHMRFMQLLTLGLTPPGCPLASAASLPDGAAPPSCKQPMQPYR